MRLAAMLLTVALGLTGQERPGDLVARHRAFLGGREALASLRTLRLEGRIEGGLRVVRFRWLLRMRPFGYREEWQLEDGGWRAVVTDGRYAWLAGEQGKGRLLKGGGAVAVLTRAFLDGLRYVSDPYWLVGRPVPLPPYHDVPLPEPRPQVVPVRVWTAAGTRLELQFDARTGRLWAMASGPHWLFFREWKEHKGLRVAMLRYEGYGRSGTVRRVRITRVAVNPELPEEAFAGLPVPELSGRVRVSSLSLVYTAVPSWVSVLVPSVRLNDRVTVPGIPDTGAVHVAVDAEVLNAAGAIPTGTFVSPGLSGPAESRLRWLDTLALPGWRVFQLAVQEARVPGLGELPPARRARMVVGTRVLFAGAPVFDFAAGALYLRGRPVEPLKGRVVRLPLHRRPGGMFEVEVTLRGRSVPLLLDTGAQPPLSLQAPGVAALDLPQDPAWWEKQGGLRMPMSGLGRDLREGFVVRLEDIRLGPITFEALWAHVIPEERPGTFADAGLLGAGALAAFPRVAVDPEHLSLEIALGEGADPRRVPASGPWLGFTLAWSPQGPRLAFVVPAGPAARAGLRPGDRLLAVDGEDVTRAAPETLGRRLWVPPGQTIRLRLQRPGRPGSFEVVLP